MHRSHVSQLLAQLCEMSSVSTKKVHSCIQLSVGLWTPDTLVTGKLLPLRSVREKMKKQMLMTPKMITPEMSTLVTVFIWNSGVFRLAVAAQKQTNIFFSIFYLVSHMQKQQQVIHRPIGLNHFYRRWVFSACVHLPVMFKFVMNHWTEFI